MNIHNLQIAAWDLTFKGFPVSPFFHTLRQIPWALFWTNHYKGSDYNHDTEFAEHNRKIVIASTIRQCGKALGLSRHDIQYFGTTEKQGGRCHTHTLICIKKKAGEIADILRDAIQKHIPWDTVTVPEVSTKERANQIVNDPVAVAAYISKLNKNQMDVPAFHHSSDFINFVENFREYGI